MARPSRLAVLTGALAAAMTSATLAHSQEMIEVPTPPEVRQRIVGVPQPTPTAAAPSPLEPLPPPIVAPPPVVPRTEWRVRRHLDLAYIGLGIFGGVYATNLGPGLAFGVWQLDVPFVGPWLTMARVGDPMFDVGLAFDGIVQAGTAVMIAVGIATKRRELVRTR